MEFCGIAALARDRHCTDSHTWLSGSITTFPEPEKAYSTSSVDQGTMAKFWLPASMYLYIYLSLSREEADLMHDLLGVDFNNPQNYAYLGLCIKQ